MNRGRYIVLEGPEGVGKTTQLLRLAERLHAAGLPIRLLREPDSQSDPTARAIRQLTQDPRYPMNTRTEVLLYNAARAQSLAVIRDSVEQGIICLVDRNYLTTLAIQYYGRGDVPDYDTINTIISFAVGGIEPDLCMVLTAPADVLRARSVARGSGERFDNLDADFLERVRAGYEQEAQRRNFPLVDASGDRDTVGDTIWRLVTNSLAQRHTSKSLGSASEAPQPYSIPQQQPTARDSDQVAGNGPQNPSDQLVVRNDDGNYTVTSTGRDYLNQAVTDAHGDVYAFKETLSPVTIAAAMARLSRRADDMRVTTLDEFANQLGKDEQLLQRVITAYGDDSVQQLAGLHVVVENASNLLTKKLEWGRLAAYLEQSTRYIYYDKQDTDGKYRYHTPAELDASDTEHYRQTMDRIFELYSDMVHRLTDYVRQHSSVPVAERDVAFNGATRAQACDAIRPVSPVATTSTVGIFGSGQALESLIMHLQADGTMEARQTGDRILANVRQVTPTLFERADKPERGGAAVAYRAETAASVHRLAQQRLQPPSGGVQAAVTLTDVWPRNEMDIVADMLYEHSSLPLTVIREQVATWSYRHKTDVMQAYFGQRLNRRHRPGRALEKIHYSWDLVCDYGIFRDLQRHRIVDDLAWQLLTPAYGYDVPELVVQAGLQTAFEECFTLSKNLYDELHTAYGPTVAQYATLLGHKMRWKVTYNAREAFHLHELRTSPQGHPGYRKLVQQMHDTVAQIHPTIAAGMRFVSTDEDPELTRLAAERYTQFKLQQLNDAPRL